MEAFVVLLGGVLCLGVVLSVVVALIARRRRAKHVAAMRAWAVHHGWSYAERDDGVIGWFSGTPFGRGDTRRASHVMRGRRRDRDVVMFEYTYTTTSTSTGPNGQVQSTTQTHRFTVVAVVTPTSRPWVQVTRKSKGRRLLNKLGVRDLQLENEEFNKVFHIETGSDRFAYDVLHPRMMAWLLDDPVRRETPFRFEAAFLLTWETGGLDVARGVAFADYLTSVLDMVPSFVWSAGS